MGYSRADLADFGRYMVSANRTANIKGSPTTTPIKEKLAEVNHADIENWKARKKKKK